MLSYLKKNKAKVIFVTFCIITLFFIQFNKHKQTPDFFLGNLVLSISNPSRNFAYSLKKSITSFVEGYFFFRRLEKENLEFKKQLEIYKIDAIKQKKITIDYKKIKEYYEFDQENQDKTILAEITGELADNYSNLLEINKGKKHGVLKNQAVVTSSGVLGKILRVKNNVAYIQLIIDLRSHLPIAIQRTRDKGIIVGQGNSELFLKFISLDSGIKKDDLIVASGLAGIFPKEFPVGIVKSFRENRYYNSIEAIVEPIANFSRAEFVFVILKAQGNRHIPLFQE